MTKPKHRHEPEDGFVLATCKCGAIAYNQKRCKTCKKVYCTKCGKTGTQRSPFNF